jgi:hypothetical protein
MYIFEVLGDLADQNPNFASEIAPLDQPYNANDSEHPPWSPIALAIAFA